MDSAELVVLDPILDKDLEGCKWGKELSRTFDKTCNFTSYEYAIPDQRSCNKVGF